MNTLLALIVLAQLSGGAQVTTLDEALSALEDGAAAVTISPVVAAQAVQRLSGGTQGMSTELLERHMQVALRGRFVGPLLPILGKHLAVDGPGLEPALRVTAGLAPRHWPALLKALGPAKTRARVAGRLRLQTACHAEEPELSRGAVILVAGAAPGAVALGLVNELLDAGADRVEVARLALEALELRGATPDVFDGLVVRAGSPELPPELEGPLSRALATFIDRDAKLGARLAEALRQEPTPALLGAVVALPPPTWDAALEELVGLVSRLAEAGPGASPAEVRLLVAAIGAAADLRCPEVFDLLPQLCLPGVKQPVRVAALRALGDMGSRDAVLIDILLSYLDEPEPVGGAAFESLRKRSGATMPHRPVLWRNWRQRTQLVERTPEHHAARLARERQRRYGERLRTLGS